MKITSKHGQQYQCILPIFLMEKNGPKEVNVTTEEINILLQPLNDTCLTQVCKYHCIMTDRLAMLSSYNYSSDWIATYIIVLVTVIVKF